MLRYIVLLGLLTILPSAVFAGQWQRLPTGTGSEQNLLKNDDVAFFVFTSADAAGYSKVLRTQCRRLDMSCTSNLGGAAGSATIRLWEKFAEAGAAVTSTNGMIQLSADHNGDGIQDDDAINCTGNNKRRLIDFTVYGLVVEIVDVASGTETPVVRIQCGQ